MSMFDNIELTISYSTHEYINDKVTHRNTILNLQYSYTHPNGGSNGYGVSLNSIDGSEFKPW